MSGGMGSPCRGEDQRERALFLPGVEEGASFEFFTAVRPVEGAGEEAFLVDDDFGPDAEALGRRIVGVDRIFGFGDRAAFEEGVPGEDGVAGFGGVAGVRGGEIHLQLAGVGHVQGTGDVLRGLAGDAVQQEDVGRVGSDEIQEVGGGLPVEVPREDAEWARGKAG